MSEHERIAAAYNAARPGPEPAQEGETMTTAASRRKGWKQSEADIAARLGGGAKRVPVSGRERGDAPDIAHPLFAVEVKTRAALPVLLKEALTQAKAAIHGEQMALVVLHQRGQRHSEDVVCMRLADFEALYGDVPMGEVQP